MYRPGDKNYYLHRDFNGDYSANGCLFLAEECVPGDSDNLIIYGHHMNSGKMFADLEKYKDKGFYEEHQQSCSVPYGEMNSIRYYQHLQHRFIPEMTLTITVL